MSHCLGEDIWTEILQWLPPKSLVQSRCVCKLWYSLISSPSFIARHLSCSSAKPRLFAGCTSPNRLGEIYLALDCDENDATYIPRFDMDLIERKSRYEIVGTVNGVFCLSTYDEDAVFCPNFGLWNPLIHKYIKLPRNRVHVRYFYPRSWYGFGFKASENDFRVLFVCCEDPGYDHGDDLIFEPKFRVKICTVRSRSWRNLPAEILSQRTVRNPDSRCLMNGVLHLLAAFNGAETLLLFDFEQEVFSFMALPQNVSSDVDVAVYKGKLSALDYDWRNNKPTCRIWSMSKYGDPASWVCVLGVYLSPLSRTLIPIKERIAGLTADGKIIIARKNGVFILRDPARRRRRWLGMKYPIHQIYVCDFVESLVFLDRESGARSLPMDDLSEGLFGNLYNTDNVASGKNRDMDECDNDYEDEDYFEGDKDKGDEGGDDEVEGDEDEDDEVEGDEVEGDGNIGGDGGH